MVLWCPHGFPISPWFSHDFQRQSPVDSHGKTQVSGLGEAIKVDAACENRNLEDAKDRNIWWFHIVSLKSSKYDDLKWIKMDLKWI